DMAQLLEGVEALLVVVEQVERAGDAVAQVQLTQVADVELGGVGGEPARLRIVGTEPQKFVRLVGAAVEQDAVEGHVEMAVVVDPFGLDRHDGGDEGGGNGHGSSGHRFGGPSTNLFKQRIGVSRSFTGG